MTLQRDHGLFTMDREAETNIGLRTLEGIFRFWNRNIQERFLSLCRTILKSMRHSYLMKKRKLTSFWMRLDLHRRKRIALWRLDKYVRELWRKQPLQVLSKRWMSIFLHLRRCRQRQVQFTTNCTIMWNMHVPTRMQDCLTGRIWSTGYSERLSLNAMEV